MKSQNTDKTLGIKNYMDYSAKKFREVRIKAKETLEEAKRKHKKDKKTPLPCYKIGDRVVLVGSIHQNRKYYLVEVIDFNLDGKWAGFQYYTIILKVTNPKDLDRIGHLLDFSESGWGITRANVAEEGIKWLNE
jgi:hypothetical protein